MTAGEWLKLALAATFADAWHAGPWDDGRRVYSTFHAGMSAQE
jgi:hypothetical protein